MEIYHQVWSAKESHEAEIKVGKEGSSPKLGKTRQPEEFRVVGQVSQVVGQPLGGQNGFSLGEAEHS